LTASKPATHIFKWQVHILCQNFQNKVKKVHLLLALTLFISIVAEFRPLIVTAISDIVNILNNSTKFSYPWKTIPDALLKLSEQGKRFTSLDPAFLINIIAEFQPLIKSAIPNIVSCLKASDINVQIAGVNALAKLSEQGERVHLSNLALLISILAEFQPLIRTAIPEIVNVFKNNTEYAWEIVPDALLKFSKQGKRSQFISFSFPHQHHS
jgi:hypothetical protein